MLAFIDESGDSGFKFARGSSEYFTCVAALFSGSFAADACDRGIDELKRTLKLPASYEFHFKECSDKIRRAFFTTVVQEQFSYHGFVLNKRRLYGQQFYDRQGFYEFTVGLICENARALLRDAKITIDKCGDREFKRRLEKSLKRRGFTLLQLTSRFGRQLSEDATTERGASSVLAKIGPADLSFRNADHKGHSSVARAIPVSSVTVAIDPVNPQTTKAR